MSRMLPSARTGRTTTEPGWVMTSRVARTPLGSMTLSRRIPKIGPSYTVMLLRTLAFTKCGVPEDFFIFVVLAQIRTAHDTQKGRFATSSRAPVLFACGDGVRLYSAFGISVEGAGL